MTVRPSYVRWIIDFAGCDFVGGWIADYLRTALNLGTVAARKGSPDAVAFQGFGSRTGEPKAM